MPARGPDLDAGDLLPGTKYRIVRQLGAGGMGIVYQVVKPPEIQGVLKLMSSELTAHEEFRTRFLDEVRVLAQLDHPNIVRVFDYDSLSDGTPFYVMELLHGRTVRDVLGTMDHVPPRVAFEITRQLCEALHCAHTNVVPVIHRDIKPENIFLHAPRHGEPVLKLIDFGVVAVADRQHDGAFVGTWKYAAPEQIRGERATPQTDLYAVGLVLYEMLCGMGPFEHCESGELVSQAHLREIPAPVSKFAPWVPPSIVELIASALAKDPRQRPRDAYAFAERLFELEWANDGKDPSDRTSEGPLSRFLSTVRGEPVKGAGPNAVVVASPNRDRLANVPLVGVPPNTKHDGPTLRGMGGTPHEPTSPGEDALLAGLGARADLFPSKKARESGASYDKGAPVAIHAAGADGAAGVVGAAGARGAKIDARVALDVTPRLPDVALASRGAAGPDAPTVDAPPSDPKLAAATAIGAAAGPDGTTKRLAREPAAAVVARNAGASTTVDSDTFASQESDARRAVRPRPTRFAFAIGIAAFAIVGAIAFAALRGRNGADAASGGVEHAGAAAGGAGAGAGAAGAAAGEGSLGSAAPPKEEPAPSGSGAASASAASAASAAASARPGTKGVHGASKGPAAHVPPSNVGSPPGAQGTAAHPPTTTAPAATPPSGGPAPKTSKPDDSFFRDMSGGSK